jgi:hypothetical protein
MGEDGEALGSPVGPVGASVSVGPGVGMGDGAGDAEGTGVIRGGQETVQVKESGTQ